MVVLLMLLMLLLIIVSLLECVLLKKMLTKFPSSKVFPVLDLYRMFLMHPNSSENYKVFEFAIEYLNIIIGHLRDESSQQATHLVALRCLVNLFQNSASLYVI